MGSAHPLVEVDTIMETARPTDGRTRQSEYIIAPHILWWGYNKTLTFRRQICTRKLSRLTAINDVARLHLGGIPITADTVALRKWIVARSHTMLAPFCFVKIDEKY